jgi:hypothetical protein
MQLLTYTGISFKDQWWLDTVVPVFKNGGRNQCKTTEKSLY